MPFLEDQASLYEGLFRGGNLSRPGALPKELIEIEKEDQAQREAEAAASGVELSSADLTQSIEPDLSDEDLTGLTLEDLEGLTPDEKATLGGIEAGADKETREEARGFLEMIGGITGTAGEKLVKGFRAIKPFLPKKVAVKGPWGYASYKSPDQPPYASKEIEKSTEQARNIGGTGLGVKSAQSVEKTIIGNTNKRVRLAAEGDNGATGLTLEGAEEFSTIVGGKGDVPKRRELPIITERTPITAQQREFGRGGAKERAAEQYRDATGGAPRSAQEGNIQLEMTPQGLMQRVNGQLVPFDLTAHYSQTRTRQR